MRFQNAGRCSRLLKNQGVLTLWRIESPRARDPDRHLRCPRVERRTRVRVVLAANQKLRTFRSYLKEAADGTTIKRSKDAGGPPGVLRCPR
jgi:hypothetical protein